MLAEGDAEILHEFDHHLLGRLGEVALDVHLADRLAKEAVGNLHCTLPARTLLLRACHLVAEELPGSGVEIIAQGAAGTAHESAEHIGLQGLQVGVAEYLRKGVEVAGLLDDDLVLLRDPRSGKGLVQHQGRPAGEHLGRGHGIVAGSHVTGLLAGPESLRHGIFHGHVLLDHRLRSLYSCKGEDLHEEGLVAVLEGGVLVEEIVVTVTHPEAALAYVEDLAVTVHQVGGDSGRVEAAFSDKVHLAEEDRKFFLRSDSLDLGDVRLYRLGAEGVAGHGVEGHLVEVGDLLVHSPLLRLHGHHGFEELVELLLVGLGDHVEGAVTGELRRERILCLPSAGCVLVEVYLGADGSVKVGKVQCRDFLRIAATSGKGRDSEHDSKCLFHYGCIVLHCIPKLSATAAAQEALPYACSHLCLARL